MSSEDSDPVKKEEVRDDEDGQCLNSMLKDRKKTNPNASSAKSRPTEVAKVEKEEDEDDDYLPINASFGSRSKGAKVKKEENGNGGDLGKPIKGKAKKAKSDDSEEDNKRIKQRSSAAKSDKKKKEEIKKKVIATAAEPTGKKREKKVYDLPGQKRDPPEERDPLRVFYETLYKQVPNSEMAQIWMMESGLLPKDEAKKVFDKKHKATLQRLGTPTKVVKKSLVSQTVKRKAAPSPTPTSKTKTAVSKKRKKNEDGSSDDDDDDDFVVRKVVKK